MRDLYRVMDKLIEKNYMVRFNCWPGKDAHRSFAVYPNEKQDDQYLYECKGLDELEAEVMKDWSHLLGNVAPVKAIPLPPGFPRP